MKLHSIVLSGMVAGGIVLAGAIVMAQTVATPKKVTPAPAPHSIAVDHQGSNGVKRANLPGAGGQAAPHSIAVDHQGGNGVRRANLPGTGTGAAAAAKPKTMARKKLPGKMKSGQIE